MKKLITLLAASMLAGAAHAQATDARISHTRLFVLLDVTDAKLFGQIDDDLRRNLPVFFQNTGLSDIQPQERFTLSVSPITAEGTLAPTSASICIPRKNMAHREERALKDPKPLVDMLRTRLVECDKISQQPCSQSPIAGMILKAITQFDPLSTRGVLLVFSDLMEKSSAFDLYKGVPKTAAVAGLVSKLDATDLNKVRERISMGCYPQVVVVLKKSDSHKVAAPELKIFWSAFFKELGVTSVQFVDNIACAIDL